MDAFIAGMGSNPLRPRTRHEDEGDVPHECGTKAKSLKQLKKLSLQRSKDLENSSTTNSNIRLSANAFCIPNYREEKTF
jgi:hypothetical protein